MVIKFEWTVANIATIKISLILTKTALLRLLNLSLLFASTTQGTNFLFL